MFCEYCGNELAPESRFCIHCGREQSPTTAAPLQPATPQPVQIAYTAEPSAAPRRSKGKALLFGIGGAALGAILLAVILLISGVFSSGGGGKIEGAGYRSPEEAAKAYLTGLRELDTNAMISAFAVESYVDHYDFEAMVTRMQSYTTNYEVPFPNSNDDTRQLNTENRRNRIMNQILTQYMLYNAPDALNDGMIVSFEDSNDISDFVEDLEKSTSDYVFKELKVTAALSSQGLPDDADDALDTLLEQLPEDVRDNVLDEVSEDDLEYALEMYLSDTNQDNLEEQAKVFGAEAEDVANIVVIFEANGDTWAFCPQAVRYDGKWYLQSLGGNLAMICGMSVYTGGIVPIG